MRFLALDVGSKRIGVARGDLNTRIAVPLGFLLVDGSEWQKIADLAAKCGTERLVLGLPRSNSGSETAQSKYVRDFAVALHKRFPNLKIYFQDESYTSVEAEERLKSRGMPYQKGNIDAEAAAIILQDFLERCKARATGASEIADKTPKTAPSAKVPSSVAAPTSTPTPGVPTPPVTTPVSPSPSVATQTVTPPTTPSPSTFAPQATRPVTPTGPSPSDFAPPATRPTPSTPDLGALASATVDAPTPTDTNTNPKQESEDMAKKRKKSKKKHSIGKIIATIIALIILGAGAYIGFKYLQNYIRAERAAEYERLEAQIPVEVFTFTVRPGETIADVRANLIEVGYPATEVDEALSHSYNFPMLAGRPEGATLEGFLWGETKEFYQSAPATEVIEFFLSEMQNTINSSDLENLYTAQGLTLYEGITLASIVQKESPVEEMPTVAQVFLDRLTYDIPLGSDVTVSYALDLIDPGREDYDNNQAALEVDSMYNTRIYTGLPFGPISNPGLPALLSVANPSDTNYLYFLTGDDGMMYYSYTEDEHNQNAAEHCQNLCQISL